MTDQKDGPRAVLENKRTELVRSIRSQSYQLAVCDSEHDLMDQTQGTFNRDQAATSLNALARTLADVDAALAAIKQGSYGVCVDCEKPIASRRLQTLPWASHCIRCQELLERRKHMRTPAPLWGKAA